jgi:DHA1 family bicyclomycin/chloramphenicol resistance-like MFS transporter
MIRDAHDTHAAHRTMAQVILRFALALAIAPILALDCFPHHRGTAASMQGFLQMLINTGVASVAVPLLHTQWLHFALGQLLFLLPALVLWFYAVNACRE